MRLTLICAAVLLSGCAYSLQVMPRDGGQAGTGSANEAGKTVDIQLGGKTYRGNYVYDGGTVIPTSSFGTATAYGRTGVYTATANSFGSTYVPGSGNGRILATAGPGDSLRCEFMFRGGSGMGVCQDNAGKAYDLLIGR